MKSKFIAVAILAPAIFVSCENPASKTTGAKVSDAVEKTSTGAEGGTKYVFSPKSEVNFIGSKVIGSHHGGFKTFTGFFTLKDGVPVGNEHKVVIDMASTFADDAKLTSHLKGKDFFNVEVFPQSTFDVTSISKVSETSYTVSGNFTLHGKTKNISFPASVSKNGEGYAIESKFNINRKDFDIVYAGQADNLIHDEVVIEFKLDAVPETAPEA